MRDFLKGLALGFRAAGLPSAELDAALAAAGLDPAMLRNLPGLGLESPQAVAQALVRELSALAPGGAAGFQEVMRQAGLATQEDVRRLEDRIRRLESPASGQP